MGSDLRISSMGTRNLRIAGLAVLALSLLGAALVEIVFLSFRPLNMSAELTAMLLLLGAAGVGMRLVWAQRSHAEGFPSLGGRRLIDALELAAIMVVDGDARILYWSRGCEELFGWPARSAIGRIARELLHIQRPLNPAEVRTLVIEQGDYHGEILARHRDGHELIVQEHIKRFTDSNGRPRGVLAFNDVTEQHKAEAALRLSEARLATAVAVQGLFIYEYDLIADELIWMTHGEPFFSFGDNEPAEPRWQWGPEHSAQVREVTAAAILSGQDRGHYDFEFIHADGSERLAEGWARVIRDDDGKPVRLLGTHLDVTERRAREQALRAGEAVRRAILATVPDALFVCSDSGVIRACSATANHLLGYGERELIGHNLAELFEDSDAAPHRDIAAAVGRNNDAPWPLPVNVRRADGSIVPISFVAGHSTVEGAPLSVVVGRDMRPTIAAEEKFHRLNAELAQVSRLGMMGEMAGTLAHELSQPLAAIVNFLGAADLLLDKCEAPNADRLRHAIDGAAEQSSRAGEIIRRLRAFILRGEADMRAEPLVRLIHEAAALALFNARSLGIRLSYAFEHSDRLVLCDRVQIQQVLVNLIRNGADAMAASNSERREMLIATQLVADGLIEISVRDSGPGIAPEILERLFSPFATTKREGLGFGLAISRRIVEAHGGLLSAAAAAPGGAIFRFTLPVMDEGETRA